MKSLKKILYAIFTILVISNIISVISNWNSVAVYNFLGFETSKIVYLIIQVLFVLAFGSGLYSMLTESKQEE